MTSFAGCQKAKTDKKSSETDSPSERSEILNAGNAGNPDAVLAKVGDTVITLGEFQKRINRQSPYVRGRYTSLEHKKEFLKNMIRFEILAGEAKKQGFDKDPDAINAMKQVMVQRLMKNQFEKTMNPDAIGEPELRAYYDANQNLYNKPEEVRVAAIITKSRAAANKAAASAKNGSGTTNKGFRELVTKHSLDEDSKRAGGDLRYFSRENKEIPKPVLEAAFALTKTGEVAGPIKAGSRFYVIRQTGRRLPVIKKFEQVADQIRDRVYREKRRKAQRDFVAGLKKATTIEVFENRLRDVKIEKGAKRSSNHKHNNNNKNNNDHGPGPGKATPAQVPGMAPHGAPANGSALPSQPTTPKPDGVSP